MREGFADKMAFKRCLRGVQVLQARSQSQDRGERHISDQGNDTYKGMKAYDVFGLIGNIKGSMGCECGCRVAVVGESREKRIKES